MPRAAFVEPGADGGALRFPGALGAVTHAGGGAALAALGKRRTTGLRDAA